MSISLMRFQHLRALCHTPRGTERLTELKDRVKPHLHQRQRRCAGGWVHCASTGMLFVTGSVQTTGSVLHGVCSSGILPLEHPDGDISTPCTLTRYSVQTSGSDRVLFRNS